MPGWRSEGKRKWALPLGVLAALILLVVLAPKSFPLKRSGDAGQPLVPDLPPIADAALVALAITLLISAVLMRTVITGVDRENLQQRKPVWMQLVILGLVFMGIAAFTQAFQDRQEASDTLPQPAASTTAEIVGSDGRGESSRALGWVLTGVIVALTVAVGAGTTWLIGKTRGEGTEDIEPLIRELDEAARRISEDADPREAVIACYIGMTDALESAGAPRRASDTPFEYVERALQRFSVSKENAHRLTELFEAARFSGKGADAAMRSEALVALDAVRAELAAELAAQESLA